jgi:nucleotide-binding universal stress UspA family protein
LHVINSMLLTEVLAVMSQPEENVQREAESQVWRMIEGVSAPGERPPSVQVDVRLGAPIAEMLAKVREAAADLLILGVHGAYGAAGDVGPLAAKCVRKAQESHVGA